MKNILSILFIVLLYGCGNHQPETVAKAETNSETIVSLSEAQIKNAGIETGKAEMKTGGIAHQTIAQTCVGMDRIGCLHIGEGRDNHPPDAFNRIKGQQSLMSFGQPLHLVGLAPRPEGRTGGLGFLDFDQGLDHLPAFHQQPVHGLVDPVDFTPDIGQGEKRWFCGHGKGSIQKKRKDRSTRFLLLEAGRFAKSCCSMTIHTCRKTGVGVSLDRSELRTI